MTSAPAVSPERILKDLRKLWGDLAASEEHGVLRACAMTLIVVTRDTDGAQAAAETVATLMHEHPSRAIAVRVAADPLRAVEAHVYAQCWMPFGKRQQICCEQIELTAGEEMLAEAAAVIRALTVPDLPVVLYCPDADLLHGPEFSALLPLATKLIVDSSRAADSRQMLEYLNAGLPASLLKADLAWARLTPWRETVAQIFDNGEARRAIYRLQDIRILYAHADDPAAAYYLGAWFLHLLGAEPHIRVARGVGPAYASVARVGLHGEKFEAAVELMADCSVEVMVNGVTQRLVFPQESEYNALREELAVVGRDSLFEQVLGLACLLRGATR